MPCIDQFLIKRKVGLKYVLSENLHFNIIYRQSIDITNTSLEHLL